MLRHLGLIAVCACIVSVGCDGRTLTAPAPPPPPPPSPVANPNTTVTVEFGGRVVNADTGGPVANVQVSLRSIGIRVRPDGWVLPKDSVMSGADGTFTLALNLPASWSGLTIGLTGPPGYDDTHQSFWPNTAADRPTIRTYPTLVIMPGESIEVRVDSGVVWCGEVPCRRLLVAASPGDPVELEIVPHDSSKPMALGVNEMDSWTSVRRLMVPPGGFPYVMGAGTARLTARR